MQPTGSLSCSVDPSLDISYFEPFRGIRAYFKLRGERLVTCPENQQTAAVEVDAKRAAREAMSHPPRCAKRVLPLA